MYLALFLLLAADAPSNIQIYNGPPPAPTIEQKLNAIRIELAFQKSRADIAEAKLEARKFEDETLAKMQAAKDAYFKLLRSLKGWHEGCVLDEAQNLKCPEKEKK